jgi:hypothetical protein
MARVNTGMRWWEVAGTAASLLALLVSVSLLASPTN